jgi:hypothetical protein
MEKRLNAASKLITGLTGERTRWTKDVEQLQLQRGRLFGDCLLAASFLSYAGAFTTDYRSEMIYEKFLADVQKRGIPASNPFKLESLLTTDAVVQVGRRPRACRQHVVLTLYKPLSISLRFRIYHLLTEASRVCVFY